MQNVCMRVPTAENADVVSLVNGPEGFTPDNEFVLGESDVHGLFVAAGFCAHGIAGAGGVGRAVSEWIVDGRPSFDTWRMDIRRFGAQYRSRDYALARVVEVYSTYYDIHYPNEERSAAWPLRRSPAYPRLVELGCEFGEKSGWERPNWFAPNVELGDSGGRPRLGRRALECGDRRGSARVRDRVAIFDETSFSKIEVTGAGAVRFLDRCAPTKSTGPSARSPTRSAVTRRVASSATSP